MVIDYICITYTIPAITIIVTTNNTKRTAPTVAPIIAAALSVGLDVALGVSVDVEKTTHLQLHVFSFPFVDSWVEFAYNCNIKPVLQILCFLNVCPGALLYGRYRCQNI